LKTWQNWLWIVAVGAVWGYAVFEFHGPAWSPHAVAGVAITVPAYCLWALARLQLGTSFAIRAQAKELVARGLYSKIQNPVYLFPACLVGNLLHHRNADGLGDLRRHIIPVTTGS
jgi:protein-S-isoprenylcysteine O-methyltransferase Ste14